MRVLLVTLSLFVAAEGTAMARTYIRKDGRIVAEIDGRYLRQNGMVVAEFDGKYVRQSGRIIAEIDGRYIRERGQIIAEIDGKLIRKSGAVAWEIEPNGNVRRHGRLMYTVDDYTDSTAMKEKVAIFLLFFAE